MNGNGTQSAKFLVEFTDKLFTESSRTLHRNVTILENRDEDVKHLKNHYLKTNKDIGCINSTNNHDINNYYNANTNKVIGKEFDLFFYEITTDIDVNLFAAVTGTIRGCGLLIIHLNTSKNNFDNNLFLSKLIKQLRNINEFYYLDSNASPPQIQDTPRATNELDNSSQLEAIKKIKHVVIGHRNRPLVLLADRGRGKSASLGIAAAELLNNKLQNIIITAPSFTSSTVVFKHALQLIPNSKLNGKSILKENKSIRFVAPDELIELMPKADLLLVDEAAAIPSPMLKKLLARYARLVFATTLHGYEGSGRGFELRFFSQLDEATPGWKKFELTHPIRWAKDDPLERFINSIFFLNAEISHIKNLDRFSLEQCQIRRVLPEALIKDEMLLKQVFALLTVAHYRTKPSDLIQILTNPKACIYVITYQENVVTTAFCIEEGNIAQPLVDKIYRGERRPKGDLIPQALIFHLGLKEAAKLKCLRIVRIATHPSLRNRGLATTLLQQISEESKSRNIDYLATSFGATPELIGFWNKLEFSCFRIGLKKEASSNSHALMMFKRTNDSEATIFIDAENKFNNTLFNLFADELKNLDPQVVLSLIHYCVTLTEEISEKEWSELINFSSTNRRYEDNIGIITKLTKLLCKQQLSSEYRLLILKILQKRDWQEVARLCDLTGKRAVIAEMKAILHKQILSLISDSIKEPPK